MPGPQKPWLLVNFVLPFVVIWTGATMITGDPVLTTLTMLASVAPFAFAVVIAMLVWDGHKQRKEGKKKK